MKQPASDLRFRQIHLDFHTSPHIPDVGARFSRRNWQETLRRAHVNSITCFAKCHHGWSYHPTRVGKMHPNLSFDLLRAQFEAAKEIGIRVPIYLSAGVDNFASHNHPEWREVGPDGKYAGYCTSPLAPGFHKMDFLSPYLDYLCRQIEEVVDLFPDCDGIFLDIIYQTPGCSRWVLDYLNEHGLDASSEDDRRIAAQAALKKYYDRTTTACHGHGTDLPVVHNSGHIIRGRRDLLAYQKHFELESLPTGGWGYDHFPEGASYVANLGSPYLGMTGKFHTTWGEFGGLKHPNALRYECASMLAFGAGCSVGDQLHPGGTLDPSTYDVIGEAYSEVQQKEPWCKDARLFSQIAVLSSEAAHPASQRRNAPDTGVARLLLEGHYLFSLVDRSADFSAFDLLILPDDIAIDTELQMKIESYLQAGGFLLLTGESGLSETREGFAFDTGAQWLGASKYSPDYILPHKDLRPTFCRTPFIAYCGSQRISVTDGVSLGQVFDPYFNRTFEHFCSHQHAPARMESSGFDAGVQKGSVMYLAHSIFTSYRAYGQVSLRHYFNNCLNSFLGDTIRLLTNLPSTARVTLTRQEFNKRWVVHVLYANTISRGGELNLTGGNVETVGRNVEVIEDLLPLHNTQISLRVEGQIGRVTLEPQGVEVPFIAAGGRIEAIIPEFSCHQMIVFHEE